MIFRLLWKKTRPLSRLADFSSLFKAKMFEPSQSDLSCTLNLFSIMSQLHSPSVLNRVVSYVHICFYSVLNRILSLFSVLYLFSFLDHVLHNVLNLFWIMFSITFIVCYYLFSICVVCSESRPQSVLDASARSASDGEERSAETDDERRPASGYLSHPGVNITVRLFPPSDFIRSSQLFHFRKNVWKVSLNLSDIKWNTKNFAFFDVRSKFQNNIV